MTEQINYYQFIKDRLAFRPYNKHRLLDGNANYIHRTDAWVIVGELNKLRDKLEYYKDKHIVTGCILAGEKLVCSQCDNTVETTVKGEHND